MNLKYIKEIYDPIHGFIRLTSNEIKIIDNLIFQRLHNISQLGTLYMVFPGARFTRFSHSLGVFHLTSRIIENLKIISRNNEIKKEKFINNEHFQIIRASALLHDIGHLPFSHCTENVIMNYLQNKYGDKIPKKKFHEWLGGEIIKKTDIYNPENFSFKKIKGHREIISQIIKGASNFLIFNQILNSELDCDRLDYLLRDAYSIGISFGQIDLEQILRNIFLFKRSSDRNPYSDHVIVYLTKAINAIDNYYFARMFMYNTVYYHKVSTYFDSLLSKSYEITINSDKDLSIEEEYLPIKPDKLLAPIIEKEILSTEEINDFYIKWHKFDDYYLWTCLRNCWHILRKKMNKELNSDARTLKKYLDLLFQRKKSNLVFEINRLKTKGKEEKSNNNDEDNILIKVIRDLKKWIEEELNKRYKYPFIILKHEILAPLNNYEIEDPKDPQLADYDESLILFYDRKSKNFHYLHNVPSSINYQKNKSIFYIFRVFYPEKLDEKEINHLIKNKFNELMQLYKSKNH
ncbi:MAG: HD domain-containing protein [Promethearchaeota archaeon]